MYDYTDGSLTAKAHSRHGVDMRSGFIGQASDNRNIGQLSANNRLSVGLDAATGKSVCHDWPPHRHIVLIKRDIVLTSMDPRYGTQA
jgi:hypothetical protein